MAIFRKVHVAFWKDSFIETLTPEQKYFYLYLITNDNTKQCGIYEISFRQICFDTGYNQETVLKLIKFFTESGKVKYSETTKEMALKNWGKYNDSTSPKVKACIKNELKKVKDTLLIQYVYSMDTVSNQVLNSIDTHSQEEREEEQEKEREQEEEIAHPPIFDLKNSNLYRQPNIPTMIAVWEFFSGQYATKEMARSFWDKQEGKGWFIDNSPIKDWTAVARRFIDTWQKNDIKRESKETQSTAPPLKRAS